MVELVVDVNLFNMIYMQRSYAHRGKPNREDVLLNPDASCPTIFSSSPFRDSGERRLCKSLKPEGCAGRMFWGPYHVDQYLPIVCALANILYIQNYAGETLTSVGVDAAPSRL